MFAYELKLRLLEILKDESHSFADHESFLSHRWAAYLLRDF